MSNSGAKRLIWSKICKIPNKNVLYTVLQVLKEKTYGGTLKTMELI
jgi:hypothetical protein